MQDAANDPIVETVEAGRDVLVQGEAAAARLDRLAARLDACNLVRVTAPQGGLSLSALIAQLSGRDRLDEQDDGALEAGFRRLCGADAPERRTVLLLDATQGVQRPVLRYLQQVGRNAPRLQFVIASSTEMPALLEAPDMARLRDRLQPVAAAPEIVAEPAVETSGRALTVVPAAGLPATLPSEWAAGWRQRVATRRKRQSRRRALMWATSALVASAALGAWLGQARTTDRGGVVAQSKVYQPAVVAAPEQATQLSLAPVPASIGAPPLAARVAPTQVAGAPTVAADAAAPAPAASPAPALARLASPETAAPGEPQSAVPASPETLSFAAVEEQLAAARLRGTDARRSLPPLRARLAGRPKPSANPATRFAEEDRPLPNYQVGDLPPEEPAPLPMLRRARTRFQREPLSGQDDMYARDAGRPFGETAPGQARYEPPGDTAYIGTYSTGPYGARIFRYDP